MDIKTISIDAIDECLMEVGLNHLNFLSPDWDYFRFRVFEPWNPASLWVSRRCISPWFSIYLYVCVASWHHDMHRRECITRLTKKCDEFGDVYHINQQQSPGSMKITAYSLLNSEHCPSTNRKVPIKRLPFLVAFVFSRCSWLEKKAKLKNCRWQNLWWKRTPDHPIFPQDVKAPAFPSETTLDELWTLHPGCCRVGARACWKMTPRTTINEMVPGRISGWWWLEHGFYFSIYREFHNPSWLSYFWNGVKPPIRYFEEKSTFVVQDVKPFSNHPFLDTF